MKKVLKTMIVAVSIFGLVGAASAAPDQCDCAINLYGASAQYKFWTSAAPGLLQSWGCVPADTFQADGDPLGDRDNGIAVCRGTTAVGNPSIGTGAGLTNISGTMCIRYTSFASFEGIYSVSDQNPNNVDAVCNGSGDLTPGCGTPWQGYRLLADEMNTNFAVVPGMGTVNGLACRDVHLGASDVEASAFQQQSSGEKKGPCGGGAYSSVVSDVDSLLCSGYRFHNPLVVPFAFFKNDDSSNPVPFDNMTDPMAAAIFSSGVNNWQDFDPDLPAQKIIACMRHAGSGTHATLYASILYHQRKPLSQNEIGPSDPLVLMGIAPITYFNKGSSDMMYCVGGNCKGQTGIVHDAIGAVGYADVDKVTSYTPGVEGKYGFVQRMLHNGFGCVTGACDDSHAGSGAGRFSKRDTEDTYKDAITHGRDTFWADQHLYSCPWDFNPGIDPSCYPGCAATDWIANVASYASNPANLPTSKANYWAAQNEMQITRANAFANITHKNPAP